MSYPARAEGLVNSTMCSGGLYRVNFWGFTSALQQIIEPQHERSFFYTSYSSMFLPVYYLTSSHKRRWFPFSFHIWFDIVDFSISPWDTMFWYSSRLTFSGRYDSHLYTLPLEVHQILSHVVFCWELDSEEIYS